MKRRRTNNTATQRFFSPFVFSFPRHQYAGLYTSSSKESHWLEKRSIQYSVSCPLGRTDGWKLFPTTLCLCAACALLACLCAACVLLVCVCACVVSFLSIIIFLVGQIVYRRGAALHLPAQSVITSHHIISHHITHQITALQITFNENRAPVAGKERTVLSQERPAIGRKGGRNLIGIF